MKYYFTTFFLVITLFSYSQTNFQKGYIIKTNNEKIDCLIKNDDWKNNPTQFTYKLSENSKEQTGNFDLIKEFSIDNESKYIKQKLDVDVSSNNLKNLSYLKTPSWESRTVFLKVLLEGEASLYFYSAPGLNRYFYNINDGKIIQLIYKRYYVGQQKIKSNNDFRQQLLNSFSNCSQMKLQDYKNVNYNAPSLSKIIKSFNSCTNTETITYGKVENNIDFNLVLKGGLNVTSVNNVTNGLSASRNVSFGTMLGYRFALESELVLPFNNNKWSLFFEFAKNQKTTSDAEAQGGTATFSYDYFEGILAMRHYMYFSEKSKMSFHLGYAWDLFPELEVNYQQNNGFVGDNVGGSFLFGIGYHYDKISIEARANFKKPIFEVNTVLYKSNSSTFNLTFGYTIL